MRNLITLDEAKEHLRVDHDFDDNDIELKISGVSGSIIAYLKSGADNFIDKDGNVIVNSIPPEVKIASKLLLGMIYKDRDGEQMEKYQQGYLPFQVTCHIYHLRVPTMA